MRPNNIRKYAYVKSVKVLYLEGHEFVQKMVLAASILYFILRSESSVMYLNEFTR